MNEQVCQILALFDALPEREKDAVATEILRRVPQPEGDVPSSALDALADELFSALDAEEAARAGR